MTKKEYNGWLYAIIFNNPDGILFQKAWMLREMALTLSAANIYRRCFEGRMHFFPFKVRMYVRRALQHLVDEVEAGR